VRLSLGLVCPSHAYTGTVFVETLNRGTLSLYIIETHCSIHHVPTVCAIAIYQYLVHCLDVIA